MSEPMRRPPTKALKVTVESGKEDRTFLIPKTKAKGLIYLIEDFEVYNESDRVKADDAFADFTEKYTRPGAVLRGARFKEGFSQKKLADKLGIPQSHISEMEHGKRPIGKKMSQRLSKVLKVSYKVFL